LKKLTEKIILLADDDVLRRNLGQSGTDFVREYFPGERMVDSIYDLYLKLAAERGIRL
jgi:glycosyltransferase involved in cell wall biosynthesis